MAYFAYRLVIWAISLSQITYVPAPREINVILAAQVGTKLTEEPFGNNRNITATLITLGVLILQISNTE